MEWDPYMETLIKHQETLAGIQDVCRRWAEGERDGVQHSEIGRLLSFVEANPHRAHRLVEVVLSYQVEFNKTVITLLTDLDYRKADRPDAE